MTFVIWTALNLLTCPDTRWVHCAFAAENAFTCRSCRGRQGALCSLASLPLWLSLRLSLYSPHLPSDTVQQAKKKSRIKLFRSAGTNFLSRPLALKLRIRTDPETESDILGKEQQGGPGEINRTVLHPSQGVFYHGWVDPVSRERRNREGEGSRMLRQMGALPSLVAAAPCFPIRASLRLREAAT